MLKQKSSKVKASGIAVMRDADKIMDKKTRRTYEKMFKKTTRRKQRSLEKQEVKRIVEESVNDYAEMTATS